MQMAAEGKMTEPIFCHRHFKSKVQHGFRIDLRAKASDGRLPWHSGALRILYDPHRDFLWIM